METWLSFRGPRSKEAPIRPFPKKSVPFSSGTPGESRKTGFSALQDKAWASAPPYTLAAPPRTLLLEGAARRGEEAGRAPAGTRARRSRWRFELYLSTPLRPTDSAEDPKRKERERGTRAGGGGRPGRPVPPSPARHHIRGAFREMVTRLLLGFRKAWEPPWDRKDALVRTISWKRPRTA